MILEFDSESNYVVGIEWGLTHMKGILSNLDGEILCEKDIPHGLAKDIGQDLERVKDLIRYLIDRPSIPGGSVRGIGVAAAGYINKRTGIIEYSPVQDWHNVNAKDPLYEEFRIPVYIDYLSRVMALGEHLYGSARRYRDFVFVTVDYGLGVGIFADGRLIQGHDGYSGEFGHIRVVPGPSLGDRTCVCGKTNCLAEFVSGRGIANTAASRLNDMDRDILNRVLADRRTEITAKEVSKAAEYGDSTCRAILDEAGTMLGTKIADVSNILNPEAVVLGGKLMRSDYYFETIRDAFSKNGLVRAPRRIEITRSTLENNTIVKGAVALVLENILSLT